MIERGLTHSVSRFAQGTALVANALQFFLSAQQKQQISRIHKANHTSRNSSLIFDFLLH
jgi:hypothetical protein